MLPQIASIIGKYLHLANFKKTSGSTNAEGYPLNVNTRPVTAALPESTASSQTKARELFPKAHQLDS
jgi:hypothetical protein